MGSEPYPLHFHILGFTQEFRERPSRSNFASQTHPEPLARQPSRLGCVWAAPAPSRRGGGGGGLALPPPPPPSAPSLPSPPQPPPPFLAATIDNRIPNVAPLTTLGGGFPRRRPRARHGARGDRRAGCGAQGARHGSGFCRRGSCC